MNVIWMGLELKILIAPKTKNVAEKSDKQVQN